MYANPSCRPATTVKNELPTPSLAFKIAEWLSQLCQILLVNKCCIFAYKIRPRVASAVKSSRKSDKCVCPGQAGRAFSGLIDGLQFAWKSTTMIPCVRIARCRIALVDSNQPQAKGEGRFESTNAINNIDDAAIVVEC